MHVHMWNSHKSKLVKEGSFRINAKLVKEELMGGEQRTLIIVTDGMRCDFKS